MDSDRLNVILVRSPDDAQERDSGYQVELNSFRRSLEETGATVSQSALTFDAIGGGGYPTGSFAIALATAVVPSIAAVVIAWLRMRAGRKVRVKVGSTHVEAATADDVLKILVAAAEYARKSKGHDPS